MKHNGVLLECEHHREMVQGCVSCGFIHLATHMAMRYDIHVSDEGGYYAEGAVDSEGD